VILPFTKRIAKVTAALDDSGYDYEAIDVSESPFRYFYVIKELWDAKETFCTIEHDIVINPETLRSFDSCPCDWDIAPYPYKLMPDGFYAGLGCCKISDRLIARNPEALIKVGQIEDRSHRQKHWCRVDGWLKQILVENNERPHAHDLVDHLGDGFPSHGPCHEQALKMKGIK
jgi:hypothetical protein